MVTIDIPQIRSRLLQHPIYQYMDSPSRIRVFMKYHVFAVWDFMSLLKRLQQEITCIRLPWMPPVDTQCARLINEIVMGEETDEDDNGGYVSHFELYLQSMEQAGADTKPILQYLQLLEEGKDPINALDHPLIPPAVTEFVTFNLSLALKGQIHEVASAFFFGREGLIPEMFTVLIQEMDHTGVRADKLRYYLKRHIELDGDHHGQMAEQLLFSLCKGEDVRLEEANRVAEESLRARIRLWDGALSEMKKQGV